MTDNFNPKNSIWPNGSKMDENGYVTFYPLGTNKIDVPTTGWPKGNKLVAPFVYDKDNHVVGFVDTKAMTTANGNVNIYLPYELIQADFSSIEKGTLGVYAPNAVIKNALWADGTVSDFPEAQYEYKGCTTVDGVKTVDPDYLTTDIVDGVWSEPLWDLTNGTCMFYECPNLTSFNSELPSLTNGERMFMYCENLTTFTTDLSSLTDGQSMFYYCENLESFSSDLSNLTNGVRMFSSCANLESFSSDLSNLTNGERMFASCPVLTSFTSNLSSLTNGNSMFSWCDKLATFTSDLPSLTNGEYMFSNCKLDAHSVKNIINTINSYSAKLTLGMGCNDTTEDKDLFAQEVGYVNMTSLLTALQNKGWTVTAQYNGRPTTTYGLRKPSEVTLPVFVKLEELEETEEYADYTSLDDTKKYRLNWFHETTGSTEGYTQFNSLEEAVEHFNIKPMEGN